MAWLDEPALPAVHATVALSPCRTIPPFAPFVAPAYRSPVGSANIGIRLKPSGGGTGICKNVAD